MKRLTLPLLITSLAASVFQAHVSRGTRISVKIQLVAAHPDESLAKVSHKLEFAGQAEKKLPATSACLV